MISSLRGTILQAHAETIVVEVGGVGLLVHCPSSTALGVRVGEQVALATVLIVREDSLTLFGFADAEQREIFELVQSVSGIGPRTALAVVSTMEPQELRRAIAEEDLVGITRVPGIGRKGAQRMVLELKDRLAYVPDTSAPATRTNHRWRDDVQSGLESLGWNPRQAGWAVDEIGGDEQVLAAAGDPPDIAVLLKAALLRLNRSS